MTLEEEKQKALFEHKLALRRIYIEKGFLAIIIAITAVLGNVLIESYKNENIKQRFDLEKRWLASNDIRNKLSDVTTSYYGISERSCYGDLLDPEQFKNFKNKIQLLVNEIKIKSLSVELEKQEKMRLVLNIFAGISNLDSDRLCKYRYFVNDISDYFTYVLKENAGIVSEKWLGFVPIEMNLQEMDEIGTNEYLIRNYSQWKMANN